LPGFGAGVTTVVVGVGVMVTFSGLYLGSLPDARTGIADETIITEATISAKILFFIILPLVY
jgi:hypothetical protein